MKHWIGIGMMMVMGLGISQSDAGDFSKEQYDLFAKCEWKSPTEGTLLYRFYKPEIQEGKKYPLILFLHGAGERGNDNELTFFQDHFLHLMFSEAGKQNPAFMLVPQCPEKKRWCEVSWSEAGSHKTPEQPSESFRMLRELLDSLKKEYPIDTNRIYVTGISMGGFGTFDWLVRYPGEAAAAMPVCGGGDIPRLVSTPEVLATPIWIFHGEVDEAVNPERSRKAFAALQEAKGNVRYTEFPGVGHDVWIPTYRMEELAKWMFEQVKK